MMVAATVLATVGCGNRTKDQAVAQTVAAETAPSVSVQQVFVKAVPQEATYTSTIQPYSKNNIVPQTAGRITKINVEIGDKVRKGQVLAEIDKTQLHQAQLQLSNAEVELGRLKALYEAGGLSKSDLDAVELQYNVAKTQVQNLVENTTLLSPIEGVITARNYDVGDMKAEAFPDLTFDGKVERLYPTIDPATRTFTAEVVVPNNFSTLRPGMFVRVTVNFGTNNSVVIPDVAVVKQQGSGERFVYILNEDGTVSYKKIVLGRRMGAEYEVLEGIADGATVVTGGQIRLKDGIKVSVNK